MCSYLNEIGDQVFAKWLTPQATRVAITSTCTMKLERFDKFGIHSKCNFENKLLEMVFSVYKRANYMKLVRQILGKLMEVECILTMVSFSGINTP